MLKIPFAVNYLDRTTMLKSTFVFLISFSACAFGQSEDFKKIQIGINVSPDICYRTLQNNNGSSFSAIIIDMRDENEIPKFGYTAGINACYNISSRIGIETGIYYSNKGYRTKEADLIFGDQSDPRYGFIYSNSGSGSGTVRFVYDYFYFDIPLKANLKIGKRKICFISSLGFAINIFSKEIITSIVEGDNGNSDTESYTSHFDYEKITLSAIACAGVAYKLNDKIELRAEPTFRYGLLKIIDTPVTGYLWSGGFNVGFYYALK
jgi:hypothetical protein